MLVLEETRPYQNPANLYEIKWHMENLHDIKSPPRWDYPLSLIAKAKDGGRAGPHYLLKYHWNTDLTTYINCSKHIQRKDADVSSQSPRS